MSGSATWEAFMNLDIRYNLGKVYLSAVYFIIFTKYVADPGWCRLNLPDMSLYLYIERPTECSIIVN